VRTDFAMLCKDFNIDILAIMDSLKKSIRQFPGEADKSISRIKKIRIN